MTRETIRGRRVPAFTPVPLRFRADGWTPLRQAAFLGALAETWSVAAAARAAGMSRESAYRLREKPGAESFAAAWDAILAQRPESWKSTNELLWHRLFYGTLKPVMRGGIPAKAEISGRDVSAVNGAPHWHLRFSPAEIPAIAGMTVRAPA